jgi:ketosteroid isomerase-like protein
MRQVTWIVTSLALLACAGCTGRRDPAALLERYVRLHRSGDVDGLLAMHTEDAEFVLPGQEPIRGRSALRDLFESDAVLGSELVMAGIHARGDTIVVDSITETSKWFRALGVAQVRYRPGTKFVLRGGRIAGTYATPFDDETRERLAERFELLLRWMRENRPDAVNRLMPGGDFRHDAASARLWLEILDEWKSATRRGN